MKFAVVVVALATITPVHAVGNVPDGDHSSEEFAMKTPKFARDYCNSVSSCAGITYRPSDDIEEHPWAVYMHSFLPPLLNKTDDWITERSSKTFVYHPGKLVSNETLFFNVNLEKLSLRGAQELCKNHTDCVAFSFPTKFTEIDGFAEIIFSRSVESLESDVEDWQTYVINDATKAEKANARVLKYDEELEEKPYSTCCDAESQSKQLPIIQDVERVDTLPRIPCNISRQEFYEQYELTRTPVMLVGCTEDWPAKVEWTIEKLTQRFGKDDTTWNTKMNGEGFGGLTWTEVTEHLGQDKSVYIFDDLNDPTKLTMKNDYANPPQFRDADMYPDGFAPSYGKVRTLAP